MKTKHIDIRIEQCLSLAKASGCPRRKLGALLIDPSRNVVLMDGYNGGPRGAEGSMCRGHWCERNGFPAEEVELVAAFVQGTGRVVQVRKGDHVLKVFNQEALEDLHEDKELGPMEIDGQAVPATPIPSTKSRAEAWVAEMAEKYPPIKSGTRMERGCHHAEMNVVCNAAANGIECKDAWLICLAEPCMMCAKMIHHAGIAKVIVVDGGYAGGKEGLEYLRANGVGVEEVAGPKDPRLEGSVGSTSA